MVLFISTKKSQIWSIEFVIGLIIFISALFIFYRYSINLSENQEETLKDLIIDAKTLSNYLISSGLPENWNTSNVILIGLTDGTYRLNETKVQYFSVMNYSSTKNMLSVINDFYVFFEDRNGSSIIINGISGIGKPSVNKTNLHATENPSDVIKVFRFVVYNGTIVRMGMYVW